MALEQEPYYCHEQIKIPPEFPDILKQFTKAAIRTQPKDVLTWSYAYFKAMANGELPPVKERLEMPVATQKTDTGLTPELLKTLNRQLGPKINCSVVEIEDKWKDLLLPMELFHEIGKIGNFVDSTDWLMFLAISATTIRSNIMESLKLLCEILTADPDCGPSRVPFDLFKKLYQFLVDIDGCIKPDHVELVLNYLQSDVDRQGGLVQPSNFFHNECPKLQP